MPNVGPGGGGAARVAVPGAARRAAAAAAAKAAAARKLATAAATAKAKAGDIPFWIQPPFDPRIMGIAAPMGSGGNIQMRRGFMIWDQTQPGYGSNRARVTFLYNPTTITVNYALNPSSALTSALTFQQSGLKAAPMAPMSQSISFSLLFDRTFELWNSYTSKGVPGKLSGVDNDIMNPHARGVLTDVLALQQYTGQLANSQFQAQAKSAPAVTSTFQLQGIQEMMLGWVYFGGVYGAFYYGYVSGFTVTYTHFTQYMVPMRCAVDVGFVLMPLPDNTPTYGVGLDGRIVSNNAATAPPVLPSFPTKTKK